MCDILVRVAVVLFWKEVIFWNSSLHFSLKILTTQLQVNFLILTVCMESLFLVFLYFITNLLFCSWPWQNYMKMKWSAKLPDLIDLKLQPSKAHRQHLKGKFCFVFQTCIPFSSLIPHYFKWPWEFFNYNFLNIFRYYFWNYNRKWEENCGKIVLNT